MQESLEMIMARWDERQRARKDTGEVPDPEHILMWAAVSALAHQMDAKLDPLLSDVHDMTIMVQGMVRLLRWAAGAVAFSVSIGVGIATFVAVLERL